MRVLITGGAGFLGQKLAHAILAGGVGGKSDGQISKVDELVLWDQVFANSTAADSRSVNLTGDLLDGDVLRKALGDGVDVVFHLAAVVSAQAEADFDLGMRVNLDGTRTLLEACRNLPTCPVFVTTSSVAAFGGAVSNPVPDHQAPTPRSTYGTTKVIGELLAGDYSRKGFIDGRIVRLPTITVRPGKPNKAASSFASSIVREPLSGQAAVCPVAPDTPLWLLSPRRAIDALAMAAQLPADCLGDDRVITLPGLTATPKEVVLALERAAGQAVAERVEWRRDPAIEAIVATWPGAFEAKRARDLGFIADQHVDEIIRAYMEDEM